MTALEYKQVHVEENSLPGSTWVYEAQKDLTCAACGTIIPANSFFARKFVNNSRRFVDCLPHCRRCRPFVIYTAYRSKTIVPVEKEYLYVSEVDS